MNVLTIYVWGVGIPLYSWVTNAEAVGVGQRGREVDALDLSTGLDVVHVVQPARRSKDIGMPAGADLRLRPAGVGIPVKESWTRRTT